MAIEEVGKCYILYSAIISYYQGTEIDICYLRKEGFFEHQDKAKHSIKVELYVIHLLEKSGKKFTELKKTLVEDYENVKQFNNLKNKSLYMNLEDGKFESPDSIISKEMVEEIAKTTTIRYKGIEPFLQPLSEMKPIAEKLKKIMEDPEEIKKMNKELGL